MANYVYNRVICSKEVLEQYFIDPDPFGDGIPLDHPYISFNRLFGVKHLGEYHDKYGVYIYYGNSFSYSELADGSYEIKFCTRWEYPIRAILRVLELSHDTQWFALEENHVYVSRFYWAGEIKEDVMVIADEFDHWLDENMEFDDSLEDPDDGVWYFLPTAKGTWQNWESTDHFARYLDVAVVDIQHPPFHGTSKGGSTLCRSPSDLK